MTDEGVETVNEEKPKRVFEFIIEPVDAPALLDMKIRVVVRRDFLDSPLIASWETTVFDLHRQYVDLVGCMLSGQPYREPQLCTGNWDDDLFIQFKLTLAEAEDVEVSLFRLSNQLGLTKADIWQEMVHRACAEREANKQAATPIPVAHG